MFFLTFLILVSACRPTPVILTPSIQTTKPSTATANSIKTTAPEIFTKTLKPDLIAILPTKLSDASDTLQTLDNTKVVIRDFAEIARKYEGITNFQKQDPGPPKTYHVGDQEQFTILNDDTEEKTDIWAILRYETEHVYFWIQNQVTFDLKDVAALCNDFEGRIYPNTRKEFGSEWSPGIDNDVHLFIVFTSGLGTYVGGYFSSEDEIPRIIEPDSNMHEMFFINTDGQSLASIYMYSMFAHEFTHMITYHNQRNEETWWSEGVAQLAEFLNDTRQGWEGYSYLVSPDIPLTKWTDDMSQADSYYAGAYLFMMYLYGRFGSEALKEIILTDTTGLGHLDAYFQTHNLSRQDDGEILSSGDVFGDWQVANLINDRAVDDGKYGYKDISLPVEMAVNDSISSCPSSELNRSVNQFGTDFIEIKCPGTYTLSFKGAELTKVASGDPHSGSNFFWSNIGNESSMTLSREFDLTGLSGTIEMDFWHWYDLEKEYDYIYYLVSKDSMHWDVLKPRACNEGRESFACGITGKSTGWQKDSVDLSAYAGSKVTIQIDYQTDLALNGEGYLIDDIAIPVIGYFSDFEEDNGGWIPNGFVRISNSIPQEYVLSFVLKGAQTRVKRIQLSADQSASINFDLQTGQTAVLIVSAISRYSQMPSSYTIQIYK